MEIKVVDEALELAPKGETKLNVLIQSVLKEVEFDLRRYEIFWIRAVYFGLQHYLIIDGKSFINLIS